MKYPQHVFSLTQLPSVLIFAVFISLVSSIFRCSQINDSLPKTYFRVKPCHRLNTSIIASSKITSFKRCLNFVVEKRGLAFNFSPKKIQDDDDDFFYSNCEVLGCPDLNNLSMLVNDSRFDYYSLYGNTEAFLNSSCLPTIGIFNLNLTPLNYTQAYNFCLSTDGHLAHILSETRSLGLGQVLATRRPDWRKAKEVLEWDTVAYVGLNDQAQEGRFVTEKGEPLECFRYRAWAPGHPRKNRKKDDCVIIDDNKTWRAVNCAKKLPFFCEIEPKPMFWNEYKEFANISCSAFTNRTLKRKCKRIKKKYRSAKKPIVYSDEIYNEDRCEET